MEAFLREVSENSPTPIATKVGEQALVPEQKLQENDILEETKPC